MSRIISRSKVGRDSLLVVYTTCARSENPLPMRLPFKIPTHYSILSAQSLSVFETAYYRMSDTIGIEGASNPLFS